MCHKSEAQGEQFPIWEKSAHAKAYATLAGDDAKAIAKEKGIEDPQKADACLKCHVTGYGAAADMFGDKYDMANGVGCESCHGAGSDYDKMSVMKAVMAGTTKPESVGLRVAARDSRQGREGRSSLGVRMCSTNRTPAAMPTRISAVQMAALMSRSNTL